MIKSKSQQLENLIRKLKGLDKQQARKCLEDRGRSCISKSFLKKAEKARKDAENEDQIVLNLINDIKMLKREDGKLYMVYPKCYCHHLKDYSGDLPKCYCYCSEAWVKELFETALQRKVNVEIEQAVQWGDDECRIRIDV